MDRLLIATLNILNLADRWAERLPLLLADMAALQPDLIGLQEVVYPMQQDRLLGAAGEGRYEAVRGWAGRPEYGNSLLVKAPLVATDVDRLDLGRSRSAHRVRLALPAGSTLVFAVTHLHDPPDARDARVSQVEALLPWLDASPPHDALIVVGDFNADPREPAYARMCAAGFRSAYEEANGREPAVTWPSGLQAEAMDTDGDPDCLDYVWLRGAVAVEEARLVFDRPAVGDPDPVRVGPPGDRRDGADRMSPRAAAKPATKAAAKPATKAAAKPAPKPAAKATTKPATKAAAKPAPPSSASPARPLRLAHRGDWRLAPENSLEALVLAAGTPGIDGVEFDVRLSRDGVPVLLHDETLERVQGRDEAVADLSAAELREAGIPSLAEVLAALPPEAFLDVELKGPGHAKATADALRAGRGKAPERAVVSSFDEASLAAMAKALPDWPRWLNAVALDADAVELATRLRCRAIAVQWKAVTAASLKRAAAAGLEVAAWTVTRPPTVERLGGLGVIAVCVEGPALDG